ncbi:MAG: transglycosylase SLT domain-containing protein [Pseudomonadota bacterium]
MKHVICLVLLASFAACNPSARASDVPAMAWDFHPEGAAWTAASLAMLAGDAASLTSQSPRDIAEWCPGYIGATTVERAAFWSGLLSALAEYESTWNADAVGGDGRWFGLVQISPATARFYGCAATRGTELRDGAANIRCALRIWSVTVARDGVVSAGGSGVAADWGPMVVPSRRAAIQAWTRAQAYCQA